MHGTANKFVDVPYSGRCPEERGVDSRHRIAVWTAGDTQGWATATSALGARVEA
jgi:hypothetical protein